MIFLLHSIQGHFALRISRVKHFELVVANPGSGCFRIRHLRYRYTFAPFAFAGSTIEYTRELAYATFEVSENNHFFLLCYIEHKTVNKT